jgi:hypothetical protein
MSIKSGEWCAGADDPEIDRGAAGLAKVILGGIHQFTPQARPLARRINAEETQVAAITAKFNVDAAGQTDGIFGDEEFASCHVGTDAFAVDAVAVNERQFHAESGVDQTDEGFDIGFQGEADAPFFRLWVLLGHSWHELISSELSFPLQERGFTNCRRGK